MYEPGEARYNAFVCSEWCVADIEVKDIMRSCNSPCSKMVQNCLHSFNFAML